jgi:hypothetical protein
MVREWEEDDGWIDSSIDKRTKSEVFGKSRRENGDGDTSDGGGNVRERNKSGGWRREMFMESVWIQDENLRVLQDKIVLGAQIWAGIGTAVLVGGFLGLPVVGLFG